jgi:hypothetical protein
MNGQYVPFQVQMDILMAMKNAQFAAVAKQRAHISQFLNPDKLKELEETVS